MLNKAEKISKINVLKKEVLQLNNRKIEYQQIVRKIIDALSDFEEMKKGISKTQKYLNESDNSTIVAKKVIEMEEDKTEIKNIINMLEELQIECNNEIVKTDNKIMEKESLIRKLSF